MPCESGPSYDDLRREKERLDRQVRAACEMAQLIRSKGYLEELSFATQSWIVAHERQDEARKHHEAGAARLKLSEAKRKAAESLKEVERLESEP